MKTRYHALAVLCLCVVAIAEKPASNGWSDYGGNTFGQRYSTEHQIQPSNVGLLQVAWIFHTHVFDPPNDPHAPISFEATPVLFNRTLYFDTPYNVVFAIDAATGALIWSFDPHIDRSHGIYNVAARGVALWHASNPSQGLCGRDAVVVATLDRRLIELDAQSGKPCPSFGNNGSVDLTQGISIAALYLYEFTSPPTVSGDTIVVGSTIGDNQIAFSADGTVRGFNAINGQRKWSWEPIPWASAHKPKQAGSANAWAPISADPEHNLVFVPTGSASVDYYGGLRPGDNRDADSLVALNASTGERVWAFQLVHHDLWDYDTASQPVLFNFRNSVPAVAITAKTGMVFVFNRLTGVPLYPIEERPVAQSTLAGETAWPTQPFSSLPSLLPLTFSPTDVHLKDPDDQKFCQKELQSLEYQGLFTPPSAKGSLIFPGALGGANWGSSAINPTNGILYTRVSSLPYIVRQTKRPPEGNSLQDRIQRHIKKDFPVWLGGDPQPLSNEFHTPDSGGQMRDQEPQTNTPYVVARQGIMTPHGAVCGPEPYGRIVALNLNTGKMLWSVAHGEMTPGQSGSLGVAGVTATAGGLVFAAATADPYLRAYDSANGRELWRGRLPASGNATPMTYATKGRQYVVIAAGGSSYLGKSRSDAVVAFALPEARKSAVLPRHCATLKERNRK